MWQSFAVVTGFLVMGVVCLYALIKGGRPEKIVAVIIAVAWLASSLLQDRLNILSPQWGVAALDAVLFFVFLGMALYWRRGWLIVACATQLLTAATHFTQVLDPRLFALGVITAYYLWSYATLIALAWGTYQSAKRQ